MRGNSEIVFDATQMASSHRKRCALNIMLYSVVVILIGWILSYVFEKPMNSSKVFAVIISLVDFILSTVLYHGLVVTFLTMKRQRILGYTFFIKQGLKDMKKVLVISLVSVPDSRASPAE